MEEPGRAGVAVTWRFYAVIVSSSLLAAAYIYVRGGQPYLLKMSAALLALALSSYLYAKASWNAAMGLRAERILPEGILEGEPALVRVLLSNRSWVPLIAVEAADNPPSLFRVETRPSAVLVLPPASSAELSYEVVPVAGRHRFGGVILILRDPLGLAVGRALVRPLRGSEIRVLPKPALGAAARAAASRIPYMGVSSRHRGWGTAFYYLREYVEGDELRFIDWRALARLGRFYVKVFEAEEALRVALVLAIDGGMLYGPYGSTMYEVALRTATTLAIYHILRGDAVDLYIYDGSGDVVSRRSIRGRGGVLTAWRLLASATPPSGGRPSEEEVSRFIWRRLPSLMGTGGYFTILITGLDDGPRLLAAKEAGALLRKSIGGLLIHVYRPAYGQEALSDVLKRVTLARRISEEAQGFRRLLGPLNFDYIVVGPRTRLEYVLREVSLRGGLRR